MAMSEPYGVLIYRGTRNLGDAMQAFALCRLLPERPAGFWRDGIGGKALPAPLIACGWLGDLPPNHADTTFAGCHIGANVPAHRDWANLCRKPFGARDPSTLADVPGATFLGCVTLTLPEYRGARSGTLYIDPGEWTQEISPGLAWDDQWRMAPRRIEQIAKAAIVHTSRLHVALVALAVGTPFTYIDPGPRASPRFGLLRALGIPPGVECDGCRHVEKFRVRIRAHLSNVAGVRCVDNDSLACPVPFAFPTC
jgi:hypothetical protein